MSPEEFLNEIRSVIRDHLRGGRSEEVASYYLWEYAKRWRSPGMTPEKCSEKAIQAMHRSLRRLDAAKTGTLLEELDAAEKMLASFAPDVGAPQGRVETPPDGGVLPVRHPEGTGGVVPGEDSPSVQPAHRVPDDDGGHLPDATEAQPPPQQGSPDTITIDGVVYQRTGAQVSGVRGNVGPAEPQSGAPGQEVPAVSSRVETSPVSTWENEKWEPGKLKKMAPEERAERFSQKAAQGVQHIKKPVSHPAPTKGLSTEGFNDRLEFFPCWRCKALLPRYETKCPACESPVKLIR